MRQRVFCERLQSSVDLELLGGQVYHVWNNKISFVFMKGRLGLDPHQETPLGIENHKTLSALIFLYSVHVWMGLSLFFWGREKNTSLGLQGNNLFP